MKLDIPYYSQFLDIDDRYWAPRACGPVALFMALKFLGKLPGNFTPIDLVKKMNDEGGYYTHGWRHDAFVKTAKEFGLAASHREEKMDLDSGLLKIKESLDAGFPVIFSVVKRTLEQTKFHMLLAIGYEFDEDTKTVKGLYYHDPESTEREKGKDHFASKELLEKDWRRMAIFFHA